MTYDRLKIDDEPLLDMLLTARESGAMVCVHAENHGIISWMVKRLLARGYTAPKYHAISHARVSEAEAFNRLIGMAALVDQPIMIFHVSTAEGAKVIREARGQGLKVFAETCPQYLFLTAARSRQARHRRREMDVQPAAAPRRRPGGAVAGAGARRPADRLVRSCAVSLRRDRQAARRAESELQADRQRHAGPRDCGCRCCSTRWSRRAGSGWTKFVELTATAPAKIYNLHPRKGSIAVGADADIAIWDPDRRVTLSDDDDARSRRLHAVCGPQRAGLAGDGAVARPRHRR